MIPAIGSRKEFCDPVLNLLDINQTQETKHKEAKNRNVVILSFYTCLYCYVGNGIVTGSCDPISTGCCDSTCQLWGVWIRAS